MVRLSGLSQLYNLTKRFYLKRRLSQMLPDQRLWLGTTTDEVRRMAGQGRLRLEAREEGTVSVRAGDRLRALKEGSSQTA